MASTIKVDNVQNQPGTNIINKCVVTTTIGAGAGETINVCAATVNLGRSGGTVNLTCGATQSGFGRTGTVNWDTASIKTGDFTAVSGNGYFVNTTSGGVTATLPTSPSAGDIVGLKDYAQTFDSNALTIGRGGSAINGGSVNNPTVTTEGATVMLVYVDGTKGWIPTQDDTSALSGASDFLIATGGTPSQCGDYEIRTFTGPGTFCVSSIGAVAPNNNVDYLVVAGGGSGGAKPGVSNNEGGGGGGGYRESPGTATGSYTVSPLGVSPAAAITITASPYAIVVGGGGAGKPGGPPPCGDANPGNTSSFSTIASAGGGRGAYCGCDTSGVGGPGGSGGGGRGGGALNTAGGTGNTPPVTPPQGQNGGTSPPGYPDQGGGGGGGATGAGANATPSPTAAGGGRGGTGATSSINGTPTSRSGGGGTACGGASPCGSGTAGNRTGPTTNAADNRGGGSGGALSGGCSGNGGSGVVIIRYKFQ